MRLYLSFLAVLATVLMIATTTPAQAVTPPYYYATVCNGALSCGPSGTLPIWYGPYYVSFTQCYNSYMARSRTTGPGVGRMWVVCSQSIHYRTGVQCTVPNQIDCPGGNAAIFDGPYISYEKCRIQFDYHQGLGRQIHPNPPWAEIPCQRY